MIECLLKLRNVYTQLLFDVLYLHQSILFFWMLLFFIHELLLINEGGFNSLLWCFPAVERYSKHFENLILKKLFPFKPLGLLDFVVMKKKTLKKIRSRVFFDILIFKGMILWPSKFLWHWSNFKAICLNRNLIYW